MAGSAQVIIGDRSWVVARSVGRGLVVSGLLFVDVTLVGGWFGRVGCVAAGQRPMVAMGGKQTCKGMTLQVVGCMVNKPLWWNGSFIFSLFLFV